MSDRPRISVVIALYNGGPYLKEELESILPQLSETDEILICDDGSSDGSFELAQKLSEVVPQIKVFRGPHAGVVENFRRGIQKTRGKYIFLADQDDLWEPEKVSFVLGTLEWTKGPCCVMHDALMIDDAEKPTGQTLFTWRKIGRGFWHNWWKNSYVGCCMAFNEELKPYLIHMPPDIPMHDQWIGMMADHYGKMLFIDKKLLRWRRHESSATGLTHEKPAAMIRNRALLLSAYIRQIFTQRKEKVV